MARFDPRCSGAEIECDDHPTMPLPVKDVWAFIWLKNGNTFVLSGRVPFEKSYCKGKP